MAMNFAPLDCKNQKIPCQGASSDRRRIFKIIYAHGFFAPLDCPCQGASSESKKIYVDFFILEKKKPKNPYFWLPQQKMGSMAGTFTIPEFN
jgi:hypothetical protein